MTLAIRASYPQLDSERRQTAEICLKCGVCCNVAHSCHVMYDHKFDPRYTFVYDCLASTTGAANPNIWLCVSCHKCEETCPYEVSPIHFIESLKGEGLTQNTVQPTIKAELAQIIATGYALPLTSATDRQRHGLNLSPLTPRAANDLAMIVKKTGFSEKLKEVQS